MTEKRNEDAAYARTVEILCTCILCIILVAGLWPFHVPANQVKWIEDKNGLHLGRYACILSSGTFDANPGNDGTSGTIEFWLEPDLLSSTHTILSFDHSEHSGDPFSLHQYKDGLVVYQNNVDKYGLARTAWFKVNGVFHDKRSVFLTIALEKGVASVYLDGTLAEVFPVIGASTNNFTGQLVIANAVNIDDSWSGKIFGFAIYDHRLEPAQVARHYESWTRFERPAIDVRDAPVALYLFSEHKGQIVHNQMGKALDLRIPERYSVLHPPFLEPAWHRYRYGWPRWNYWTDVGTNIAGFIPAGFILMTYLSTVRKVMRPGATVILLGVVVSLIIEILQGVLPTRDSDMTDVIANTLGTAIGVMLCRWVMVHGRWINARWHVLYFHAAENVVEKFSSVPKERIRLSE